MAQKLKPKAKRAKATRATKGVIEGAITYTSGNKPVSKESKED